MSAAAPGRLKTVFAWLGGRRLHLLTWGELSARRQAAVVHATDRIADVDDLEQALGRIFRHRIQRRLPAHVGPDLWFEVGP
jgi:hypothetical protein